MEDDGTSDSDVAICDGETMVVRFGSSFVELLVSDTFETVEATNAPVETRGENVSGKITEEFEDKIIGEKVVVG